MFERFQWGPGDGNRVYAPGFPDTIAVAGEACVWVNHCGVWCWRGDEVRLYSLGDVRGIAMSQEQCTVVGVSGAEFNVYVINMSSGVVAHYGPYVARTIDVGTDLLILDEPTAALGVKQSANVLKVVARARGKGLAVILITHNVHHAYPVGNSFTVLNRGKSMGTFQKKDISREKLLSMMAGGEELDKLEVELQEMDRIHNKN